MKVTFGISLDEFRTLQPPSQRRAGRNTAYALIIALICLFLIVPSIVLIIGQLNEGREFPAAVVAPIALGIALCILTYFLDTRSIRRARLRRERELRAAYERVHCRDERTMEATPDGLSLNCKCGLVLRPWTELTGFTETPSFLIALTRSESFPVPKSAFSSEGELTEFRQLILEKLHTDRPFTACPVEFVHTRGDFWHAKMLHMRKGGGWRRMVKILIPAAAFIYFISAAVVGARSGRLPAWLAPLAIGGFALFLAKTARPQKLYYGPLCIYFSDEGFHVVDPASQSRRRWSELAGYLEDKHVYLLYLNPRLYRIVPKRALGRRETEFRRLIDAALPPFDYRRTVPVADTARI